MGIPVNKKLPDVLSNIQLIKLVIARNATRPLEP